MNEQTDENKQGGENTVGLIGLNRQLNYQRKFVSPERVTVTIPTLPFQSIDIFLPGFKIKPWELLNLLVSARSFTQWPAQHADKPDSSIIDSHLLMKDRTVFIVAMKLEVSRMFNNITSPKFPLEVDVNVTHVGNGSSRRRYVIKHPSMESPYVIGNIDDVVLSRDTGKPTAYPDWWKMKFGYINQSPQTKFSIPPRNGEDFATNECKVEFCHLDHNKHTTFSAYVLFCFNDLYKNLLLEKTNPYKSVTLNDLNRGVKSMTMVFHRESKLGDVLTVESWEPRGTSHTVRFHVKKLDGTHCSSVCVTFYSPENTALCKM